MKILLCNDDGVHAPGIQILEHALSQLGHVQVVAPDRNCSGASNSLTLDRPIYYRRLENGYVSIEGTPTDCVQLALCGDLLDFVPDLVVSGINDGGNMGDDVLYSGTVAAAMEARFLGKPAIAVSLVDRGHSVRELNHYAAAAEIVKRVVVHLQYHPMPATTVLNLNIPDLPLSEIQGFEVTRLGERDRSQKRERTIDPRGREVFWIGPNGPEDDAGPGTDFHAIKRGFVSVTPLQIDLTNYKAFDPLVRWIADVPLREAI